MADVNDADPLGAEVADDFKKPPDLVRGQSGAGFVHDKDAGIKSQGFGNFDELLLGGCEAAARSIQIQIRPEPLEEFAGAGAFSVFV